MMLKSLLLLLLNISLLGCTKAPTNPSFPITFDLATADMARMRKDQRRPLRPLVVSGGYFDVGFASGHLAIRLREFTHREADVIAVTYTGTNTLEEAADRLIQTVQEHFPSQDPGITVPVDVIGISMGGLVARRAAEGGGVSGRRLNAKNIFTIVTPHRGANLAGATWKDVRVQQMATGSEFLKNLTPPDQAFYENLYSYARLDDWIVGESNTSPWGVNPWWVKNMPLEDAHVFAYRDRRILVDIVRRIRGEQPWSTSPAAPLPGGSVAIFQDLNKSQSP